MHTEKLKFIDLFAGIGGFHLAFHSLGADCVFASEIDVHARKTYHHNFKNISPELFASGHFNSDITLIDPQNIPDFDILCAGFPCQPFSICGKKKGFEDTRGTLFFDICNIIKEKSPKVVFLENVKHLLHHDNGQTIQTIIESLEDLGYYATYKVINSVYFGVPQNRERVIIIASRSNKFDFSKIKYHPQKAKLIDFLDDKDNHDFLDPTDYTILDNFTVQPQSGLIFSGYRNKNIWKKGIRPNTKHLSRVHRQPNRIYSVMGTHPTLPSQETSGRFFIYNPNDKTVRKMTLRECYRIMGFPDSFDMASSASEAYKQIGNSVCIPMIQAVGQSLIEQYFTQNMIKHDTHHSFTNITRRIRQQDFFEYYS